MLTLQVLRQQQEAVVEGLRKRHFAHLELVEQALALDDRRRALQQELDALLAQSNQIAKNIGTLLKAGQAPEAEAQKAEATRLRERSTVAKAELDQAAAQLEQVLLQIPNKPHTQVVAGTSADDNETYQAWPQPLPQLYSGALPHWELIKQYDLIDFELGAKITGAGFPVYKGKGAKLQRALIAYFLDRAIEAGYYEVIPPHVVNADSGRGTGQLPDKEAQMYHVGLDDLYLIPTAEVPVTNLYRDVLLQESELPIKLTAYTPCFRREAGAYGAHVRGLNRLHQFDKVEIVVIEHPERSYDTLHHMLHHVETLLADLQLPYRILRLCGGDMGFASAMTYDFEVYSAAQQRWLEVSSVSNFETFQSNRLQCRFKNKDKKTELVHTLNGSALALPRIVAALLENHQTPEGINIPPALQAYTGFSVIR